MQFKGRSLSDWFIPHQGNDYSPHILQQWAVLGILVMVFFSFTITNLQALLWITSDYMVSTVLPAVVIKETNKERQTSQLKTLSSNETLALAAKLKAEDMAKKSYFSHYTPEGFSPWYWFTKAGYDYVYAGENLAVHFTDSSEVVEAWMDSPSHRSNILNDNYTEIGIGTARGKYENFDTIFVVQLFGTPAKPKDLQRSIVNDEVIEVGGAILSFDGAGSVAGESVSVVASDMSVDSDDVTSDMSQVSLPEEVSDFDLNSMLTNEYIADIDAQQGSFSSYIATSRPGEVLVVAEDLNQVNNYWSVLTKPKLVLLVFYLALILFVFLALLLSIFIEIRKQRPVQIIYGVALIVIMIVLLKVQVGLLSGALIV